MLIEIIFFPSNVICNYNLHTISYYKYIIRTLFVSRKYVFVRYDKYSIKLVLIIIVSCSFNGIGTTSNISSRP